LLKAATTAKEKRGKLHCGRVFPFRNRSSVKLKRKNLQVSFTVVNDGSATVNPKIGASHLSINGVEPKDWIIVINNGLRSREFEALPPGHFLSFGYELGGRYFAKPGIYTVRWWGENFRAEPIFVCSPAIAERYCLRLQQQTYLRFWDHPAARNNPIKSPSGLYEAHAQEVPRYSWSICQRPSFFTRK
jgi:hypothetical protein